MRLTAKRADRPIVWVIKEQMIRGDVGSTPMDYSSAMEYGDIEFITNFDPPLITSGPLYDEWERQVTVFIREYEPEIDYLILTGAPLAIFRIGAALGNMMRGSRRVNVLAWKREQNRYVPTSFQ